MIPQFELENGMVLAPMNTGLRLLIHVTDQDSAVGYRERPRLIVYQSWKQTTITTDIPIEVISGASMMPTDWADVGSLH